jgi:hypothetical protein
MVEGIPFSDMLNQSITVLTKPGIASFEQFEKRGGIREALIYVGAAAAVAGVVALIFGLLGGITSAIVKFIGAFALPVVAFIVFAYVLYFMGKQQGGTGTQEEVFYTCALYTAPLLAITGAISNIPVLNCLLLPVTLILGLYQLYLGYVASRSSMNLEQTPAIISVVVAIVAQWILFAIFASIIAAMAIAVGVGTGAISR